MNVREEFERIRKTEIEAYETELKLKKERTQRKLERERRIGEQFTAIVKQYGADVSLLHAIHDREEKELEPYLKENRPPLTLRAISTHFDEQVQAMYSAASNQLKLDGADFLGAYLLAPRKDNFEDIPGESGNPWLFPAGAQKIQIGDSMSGSGSGCWTGLLIGPTIHTSVFSYVPQNTGVLRITPLVFAHGFYIVKADDTCVSCKKASVLASTHIATVQNNVWQYSSPTVLVDLEDDNISDYKIFDQWINLSCDRFVQSNNPLLILVRFQVQAVAKGGGSYAEVNFKTGQNHILCPQVWVHPVWGA